jgi:FlaG/FlaF family flagellin (archaellin)
MKMISKNKFTVLQKLIQIAILTSLFSTSAQAIVFHKPLLVDHAYIKKHGDIISGNYQGDTGDAAITILTSDPVTIINSTLTGPGDMIQALVDSANITVTNTTGASTNPNVRGVQKGIFLHVNNFSNINMQNNTITGMRLGFFCKGYTGDGTTDNTLIIDKNTFVNIDARPSDGKGAYETTGQYNGQAIHLGNIFNVPGIDIGWNEVINTPFQSSTGALIEINESSGTSASPMQIHDNYIQGAFPSSPGKDLYDFGGILVNGLPDDTAATASSFLNIVNNRVVATANYGIAIVAGHDVNVTTNRVVSSGFLSTGQFYPMTASYGNAFGGVNTNLFSQASSVFFNNLISTNVLGLIRNDGTKKPVRSDWSLPGQNGDVAGNTDYLPNDNTDPTLADEAQELADWLASAKTQNIVVGAH